MLRTESISKRFGDTMAVDSVDLEVAPGETVALLGPSGCGKSTLLRLLAALVDADEGRVLLVGEPLSRRDPRRRKDRSWRRRLGYVIQDGGLFPHLTGRGNVTLQARHFGWSEERIEQRVAELAELVHLPQDALCRYPAQLSGGQKQRIGLVRALMMDPDVLLLDEPLGALDPLIRAELQRDLREIFRSLGKTVVLVTHDLAEARYLGDRIVLMSEGRVVQRGRFEELRDEPASDFVRDFLSAQRALHALDAEECEDDARKNDAAEDDR